MRNQKFKKILCQHCKSHIGNKYEQGNNYKDNTVVNTTKNGQMLRTKVRGSSETEPYGNYSTSYGFELEVQIKCLKEGCGKKTTTFINNSN
jgi:hypothetical protein